MLFRRDRPKKVSFEEFVKKLQAAGFETGAPSNGRVKVSRRGIAAVIENGGDKPQLFERAGVVIGDEIGTLVDGGFQKFFRTPGGVRKPAVATELKAIHEFEEDLRESLGLTSLYNQSLGSVSNVYLYDRVKGRDSDAPKKPWEKQVRGEDSVEKV
jgi:hypothetical protein